MNRSGFLIRESLLPVAHHHCQSSMASASSSSSASIPITPGIDLDSLIQKIDTFLSQKSCPRRNSGGKAFSFSDMIQPASADMARFLDGISKRAKMISDQRELLSEAGKTAVAILKQIGNLHVAVAGFLVLASVLDRLEKISFNQKQCWLILKRLNDLAKCLKVLKETSGLGQALDKKADEAFLYIVQGAIMCLTQIQMKKRYKLFLYKKHQEDLHNLEKEISDSYAGLNLSLATAIAKLTSSLATANAVSKPIAFSPSSTAELHMRRQNREMTIICNNTTIDTLCTNGVSETLFEAYDKFEEEEKKNGGFSSRLLRGDF